MLSLPLFFIFYREERLEERLELRPSMLTDAYARSAKRLIVVALEGVLAKAVSKESSQRWHVL